MKSNLDTLPLPILEKHLTSSYVNDPGETRPCSQQLQVGSVTLSYQYYQPIKIQKVIVRLGLVSSTRLSWNRLETKRAGITSLAGIDSIQTSPITNRPGVDDRRCQLLLSIRQALKFHLHVRILRARDLILVETIRQECSSSIPATCPRLSLTCVRESLARPAMLVAFGATGRLPEGRAPIAGRPVRCVSL